MRTIKIKFNEDILNIENKLSLIANALQAVDAYLKNHPQATHIKVGFNNEDVYIWHNLVKDCAVYSFRE